MKNNLQRKVINVDKSNLIPLWTVKELDDCILKLSLFKNNVAFDVTGQTLSLGAKTPIGLQEQSSGITFNSNEVDIQLKNSIVAKKGIVEIDLNIKDASGSMTTASFFIVVGEKVLNDAGVEASEQFDSLTQLIKECEDVLQNGGAVNIVDNLTSTSTTSALSAKQGNVLNVSISDIKNEIDAARGSSQFLGDRLDCIDSTIDNMVIEYSDESISVEFPSLINDINTIAEKQDELFQSVSNGKSLIASAITDKGIPTLATSTFQTMADNIRLIETTSSSEGTVSDVKISTNGLVYYADCKLDYPSNGVWKSLYGSKFLNVKNPDYLTAVQTSTENYINNNGKVYCTLEENLDLGTSMTLVMKINPNSISGWTELFSFGVGDNAISLTYGNTNNPILFAHDDVVNNYITLTANKWYEVATVLYLDKIKYYINGVLVGIANLDSTKSTEGMYEDINYLFSRGDNNRLVDVKMEYIEIYSRSLSDEEIKSNFDILNPNYEEPIEEVPVTDFSTDYFTDSDVPTFDTNAYFISPNGADTNNGTSRGTPLKTLNAFFNIVNNGTMTSATLYFEDGIYPISSSYTIGGNTRIGTSCEVKLEGIGNKARLVNSVALNNSLFTPTTINGKTAYVYDVSSLTSLTLSRSNCFDIPKLIVNGKQMDLAYYPKNSTCAESTEKRGCGYIDSSVGKWYCTANAKDGAIFSTVSNWSGVILEGAVYTYYLDTLRVSHYDSSTNRIYTLDAGTTTEAAFNDAGVMYRLVNAKEFLTNNGEYYIDLTNKKLYFIPPSNVNITSADIRLLNTTTNINTFNCVENNLDANGYGNDINVTFKKINFEGFKSQLSQGAGGLFYGCLSGITFEKCRFSGLNASAIFAINTKDLTVRSCRFSNCNGFGVSIANGIMVNSSIAHKSRQVLAPSNVLIENCSFEEIGHLVALGSYYNCIRLLTVGAIARNNKIKNCPGIALLFQYNDNLMQDNDFENCCYSCFDTATIYSGRDLLAFGNIVERNRIWGHRSPASKRRWLMGIYMDDMNSGVTMRENTIEGVTWGIYMPGGCYLTVDSNTIKDCTNGIRGTDLWWNYPANACSAEYDESKGSVRERTQKLYPHYLSQTWQNKYGAKVLEPFGGAEPKVVTASQLNAKPYWIAPRNNVVTNNKLIGCDIPLLINTKFTELGTISNNTIS